MCSPTKTWRNACNLSAPSLPVALSVPLYLTFAQKVAFLPCPPSSFSRLEVYSNENFFDGLVRMRPPSPPLPCTSSLCSWPKLAPHLNHLFQCFVTRRWTLWEHLLCFFIFISPVPCTFWAPYHQLWCSKHGKEVGTQVWVNKDAIHSAYMYWLFKADCPAAL